jgi:hypothetical protein
MGRSAARRAEAAFAHLSRAAGLAPSAAEAADEALERHAAPRSTVCSWDGYLSGFSAGGSAPAAATGSQGPAAHGGRPGAEEAEAEGAQSFEQRAEAAAEVVDGLAGLAAGLRQRRGGAAEGAAASAATQTAAQPPRPQGLVARVLQVGALGPPTGDCYL